MAEPRLLVDETLRAGAEIALDEGRSRHVGTVLRLSEGEALRVFNGVEGEWRATIVAKTKRGVTVRVGDLLRAPRATPDLDLMFAPVKRHATDLIVEKATELGVRRIRPVITQRTIAETVRIERLQAIAREAAEQTGRFDAPEILAPLALAKAVDGWDAARPLIYADETSDDDAAPWGGRGKPIAEALSWTVGVSPARAVDAGRPRALALLIGPEGGFAPEERRMLRALPFVVPVSLGPRILRAETAAIAALSVIQSAWGDWR